ncbi:MAG: phosphoglucosamine mutase [Acidobacteriota bacterium]
MKPIRSLKISISGVRGIIGESLDPALLARFAQSFGTYRDGGTIVVGRDTRTSGQMVKHAVLSGLISTGCKVVDVDIAPVPTIQSAVRHAGASGGIAITASHNPAEWNALKFIKEDGCFLNPYQAEELLGIYHQQEYHRAPSGSLRSIERRTDAVDVHLNAILAELGALPGGRRLRVAFDCCNGAGAVATPHLLERLSCDQVSINTTPDGLFPHPPEPTPQNLGQLGALVRKEGADIGFAQDADADRLAIVDERGEPLGEEYTLALAVDYILSVRPGPVVTNLSTSRMLDDIARHYGVPLLRTRIGEVNVTEGMKKAQAIIGGEGNGGVIYPKINFGRDSLVAMTLVLHSLARAGGSISELAAQLPRYTMVKDVHHTHPHCVRKLLERIRGAAADRPIDETDGIKIFYDQGWVHIRASNTEPIVRVLVEHRSDEGAQALLAEWKKRLADWGA